MTSEATSLLPPRTPTDSDSDVEAALTIETPMNPRTEILALLHLAGPMFATFLLEILPGFLSIVLVGHMNSPHTKEFVDAATMSTVFFNVCGLSIGVGLTTAMDTLCSQCVGAGKEHLLGMYLQSGLVVLLLAYVPMLVLNWHTTYFLEALGQDPMVATLAGDFSCITIFSLPLIFVYELLKKVLQAQEIVSPMVYIAVLSNFIFVAVGYYLCYVTDIGFLGAAYARVWCTASMPILALLYLAWRPVYKSWWPTDTSAASQWRDAVAHVPEFITLGIPGMLMMLMEWWALEILAFMAGWLPSPVLSLSVHSVLVNITSLVYSVYFGISEATTVRIGLALGANEPMRARAISGLAQRVAFVAALLVASFFVLTHNVLPALFINDPDSIAETQRALYLLALFEFVDGTNCVVQGILRGMGRQSIGAYVNAAAYYAVGIPMAALFGFYFEGNVFGLWAGIALGLLTACCIFSWILRGTDWRAAARNTFERMADTSSKY
ncbi:hypothetical protein SDRG_17183 [Saprolegnia diclina VS20]|uniref:Multidrug/Oligosaccharidyl-lipid/Polysaccharide (MOP) Flippase Superfamily n=2 Tax=Saprolegnia diclina (strain VS20) TaxID=1156394 RepID=T0PV98_SAPDV|nr:hypothetical protein SDRG_17183 [Saprolegnia diclina VS20]EQC24925.1 hypothetical protein SDRG_17183 [Saprolegnia diclina VS20]|eukprot:XP_008621642.1 hypothetical protein SDRG_17183 [Saprolegnia diclina VS20]